MKKEQGKECRRLVDKLQYNNRRRWEKRLEGSKEVSQVCR